MSNFFIDRPIFATVLAIVITLAGVIAFLLLPVARFPQITPPSVVVSATFPGADASTIEQSVAAPIETQVNGVPNMIYMDSRSSNDGSYTLNVTFEVGTAQDIAAVDVTLVAAVANDYFQLISLDSQLEITRRTVVTREKFLELTHAQHERGYATGLDVATAEAQLAAARATVPDLERQITQAEDQISVLAGSNPGPITRTRYGDAVPAAPPLPPAGLPSQLLERRPDVAQAEQTLVAANAEIGAAKAALFPNISLTGSTGSLSLPFSNVFTAPAAEWSAGVGLIQPLLSVQSNLYQVDLADARKREALFEYEKTLQGAFQDVADALIAYRTYGEQEREQATQVDALRRARAIALARYQIGYASYFDVIEADRDLFAAELALAQVYGNNLSALVHLYSSLGGGWQAPRLY